jgi:hypothetical protein
MQHSNNLYLFLNHPVYVFALTFWKLRNLPTQFTCVSNDSQDKQGLFPCITLIDCLLLRKFSSASQQLDTASVPVQGISCDFLSNSFSRRPLLHVISKMMKTLQKIVSSLRSSPPVRFLCIVWVQDNRETARGLRYWQHHQINHKEGSGLFISPSYFPYGQTVPPSKTVAGI